MFLWSAAILFATSTPINRERRLQGLEHHNSPASTLYLPSYGAALLISILNYGPAEIGVVINVFFCGLYTYRVTRLSWVT